MSFSVMPSVLSLTNSVLKECGIPAVSSLNPGNDRSSIVLEALNDGCADVYSRGNWEFEKVDGTFALVAGQDEYALPSDFERLQLPPRVTGATSAYMVERTAEEFWNESYGAPDVVASTGSPQVFYIGAGKIHFWPAPDTAYITNAPNLTFTYFKNPPARLEVADEASSLDLPLAFYDAMKKFAKARLKQYLGSDDGRDDTMGYEQALQVQRNRSRQGAKAPQCRPLYGPTQLR